MAMRRLGGASAQLFAVVDALKNIKTLREKIAASSKRTEFAAQRVTAV
jgi:hypothetical protein